MLKYSSLLICLLAILSCKVTKKGDSGHSRGIVKTSYISQAKTTDNGLVFPDDWLGFWGGDLDIYDQMGLKQSLPMALDNSITDVSGTYTWAIIYGSDSIAGRRDYLLKEIDKSKGHYIVDEKNGILLDAYFIDNELISVFEVMGNTLTSVYKREGNTLVFEITMYKSQHLDITGDTIIGSDTIPPVKNFKPMVRQKAVLNRRD